MATADFVQSGTIAPSALDLAVSEMEALMEALIAAYALMAHADGEVAGAERRRFLGFIRETPSLYGFPRGRVTEEVANHEANFRLDPEVAQQMAREKLQPVAGKRRATRIIVAACREIIPADGVAHPGEYRALAEIKALLGVEDLGPAPLRNRRPAIGSN